MLEAAASCVIGQAMPSASVNNTQDWYAQHMALSDQQLLNSLSRTPFVDSAELARVLGEPHASIHRALTGLLADGIVGRVSHGTAHRRRHTDPIALWSRQPLRRWSDQPDTTDRV